MSRCALHQSCRVASGSRTSPLTLNAGRTLVTRRPSPRLDDASYSDGSPVLLPELLDTLTSLRDAERRPTASAYGDFVRLAANYQHRRSMPILQGSTPAANFPKDTLGWDLAVAALNDAFAGRVNLVESDYEWLMTFTHTHPATLPYILDRLPRNMLESEYTLSRLCRIAIHQSNVERLLTILSEMWSRQIQPSISFITHAVRLCCDVGLSRIALDLARKYESESAAESLAPSIIWTRILRSSAETFYYEGVDIAWSRIVANGQLTPDEGLLVGVMNVAARAGKPEMVSRVLEQLPVLGLEPKEHHLVALLEAYVNSGQVPQALRVLSNIRSVGLEPTSSTAEPILAVLNSPHIVDQAFWALEDLKGQGEAVDITALNAIIEASARLGDLERVRANQMAAADLGVRLDIESYNLGLKACENARHRQLGDTMLKEMADAHISPNGTTYQHMILLCLSDKDYDDAFYFLEQSKSEGYKPPAHVYQRLALRCEASRDPRGSLVVEEMQTLGYTLEPHQSRDRRGKEGSAGVR